MNARKHLAALALALFALIPAAIGQSRTESSMNIEFDFKGTTVTASLYDTDAARDFVSQLPLTLEMEDYASNEKIGYPPRKLDISGEPEGFKPIAGDFAYYAPWGNIAFFYQGFSYSRGLVRLGRVTSGLDALAHTGTAEVTIRLAD